MLYFICEEILDILVVRNSPQMSKSQASYANLIHTEIVLTFLWQCINWLILLFFLVYKENLRPITFKKKNICCEGLLLHFLSVRNI